jgi:hypothetical protein
MKTKENNLVRYEYEGVPSPKYINLKKTIDSNSIKGSGNNGIPLFRGDRIRALHDTIVSYGTPGFITAGSIVTVNFANALGECNVTLNCGEAYHWIYGTKITFYNCGMSIRPKREWWKIVGVRKKFFNNLKDGNLSYPFELSRHGGYSSVAPYQLGLINPLVWEKEIDSPTDEL